MKRLKHHFVYSLVCGLVVTGAACATQSETQLVILATSTSVSNSGLLDVLLPAFEQVSGARIDGHLVGSGLALQMLDREQADLVISHAPTMEASFLAKHPEWSYKKLMYNQFLLVGPLDDPANVLSAPSIEAAMQQIVEHGARFVSRGDESGTHTREQQLFTLAGVTPSADQLVITGQSQGRSLRIASEIEAYLLTDESTFARAQDALDLQPVFQGGPQLLNTYAVIMNTEDPHQESRERTKHLFEWLTDGGGRTVVAEFKVNSSLIGFSVWPLDKPRDQPSASPY